MKVKGQGFVAAPGQVTCLMLISGHQLLGRVDSRGDDFIALLRLVHFNIVPVGPGQMNMEFAAYAPLLCVYNPDKPWMFGLEHVVAEIEPSKQVIERYVQAMTGLQVASAKDMEAISKDKGPAIPGFQVAKR